MIVKTFFASLSVTLVILMAGLASAAEPDARNARELFFTQTFGDLTEDMRIARDEGKLGMLLFFEAEDCPYCQHMLKNVFSQKSVQEWYAERFVSIAVDIRGDVKLKDFDGITLPSRVFSDQRRIFLTPVMSFINLDGIEIHRQLGMIRTPEEFLLLGEYIEDEHYYDTEYAVFSKSRGMQTTGEVLITPAADPAEVREN
jgi:thioredoxin-related protein